MSATPEEVAAKLMGVKPVCRNCKWWWQDTIGFGGKCHRYPPSQTARYISTWISTKENDWCGEFSVCPSNWFRSLREGN